MEVFQQQKRWDHRNFGVEGHRSEQEDEDLAGNTFTGYLDRAYAAIGLTVSWVNIAKKQNKNVFQTARPFRRM